VVIRRYLSLFAPVALAALVCARSSKAGPPARLAYAVPSGCPSEAEFVAAVSARGGLFDRTGPEPVSRAMDVSIRRGESGFTGSFQLRDGGNASGLREVHAASCTEVMEGLAVVTAIALRADSESPAGAASANPSPGVATDALSAPPNPAPSPAVAPSSPPASHLSAATQKDEGRLVGHSEFGASDKFIDVDAGTIGLRKAIAVTAAAGVQSGLIPSLILPRYDVTMSRADFLTTPGDRSYLVGPILRLRASFLGEGTYRSKDASTDALGVTVGMSVCLSPIYDTRALVVLLCGELGGGVLQLQTKSTDGSSTKTKVAGFGSTALEAESEYNLGGSVHLNLKVGVDFLLNPLTAERADGSQIFQSSQVAPFVLAGVGIHF
jgi:hypothetical protein